MTDADPTAGELASLRRVASGWVPEGRWIIVLLDKLERQRKSLDEALTLLADAVADPEGAITDTEWARRMVDLAGMASDEGITGPTVSYRT